MFYKKCLLYDFLVYYTAVNMNKVINYNKIMQKIKRISQMKIIRISQTNQTSMLKYILIVYYHLLTITL